jgi:glycosyltransferase involved in cell wall biosynthesis
MASCLRLLELKDEFDLVHNHLGYHALPFLAQLALPVVTTIHNPIKEYCRDIFLAYRHLPFVSISESFRALNLPDRLNYIGCVYNGIDTDAFANVPKVSREYLLFVGRISNDKGTAEAIDIAKALGLPIKIAGKIDSNDATYFANQIKPRLEAYERAEYVGEVNHDQKRVLYAGARAVVYPINFDEPFGLVMAESLASGTPVMACDRGSVREIIVDCETGIIGKTKENLINRYSEIASISSENCVRRVSECFSVKKMVDGYENIYRLLAETDSESKEPFEMTLSLQ